MPVIIVVHLFLNPVCWFISQFISILQLFSYYWNPFRAAILLKIKATNNITEAEKFTSKQKKKLQASQNKSKS